MKAEQVNKTPYQMKSLKGILPLFLLSALTACGGSGNESAVSTPAPVVIPPVAEVKPGLWVVMGSSTAAGAGAPSGKGWVALLANSYRERGVQIVNIAKGGTVTYQGLSTAALSVSGRPVADPAINIDQALSRNPVLLLVSYPANDIARGYGADETVSNLLAIRSQALAAKVPVIVLSSQPRNLSDSYLEKMKVIDRRLATAVGACFVEVRQALAGPDGRLSPIYDSGDGVHPNEQGHNLIQSQVNSLVDSGSCVKLAPQ